MNDTAWGPVFSEWHYGHALDLPPFLEVSSRWLLLGGRRRSHRVATKAAMEASKILGFPLASKGVTRVIAIGKRLTYDLHQVSAWSLSSHRLQESHYER